MSAVRAPDESFAKLGDVRLCYETFGDPSAEPVLLVMGLATQMLGWHEDFCEALSEREFFVVRYDNRDIGRSTHFHGRRPPAMSEIVSRRIKDPAYTLSDMAADGIGLLDHLGLASAHVVGASMGGMIAQTMAAEHPDRVRSLVSIMSTTGNAFVGRPALRAYPVLLTRAGGGREAYVARAERVFRLVGSPGFEPDLDRLRELAGLSYDRGVTAAGVGRQLGAILASGDRSAALRRIAAPTLVVHGRRDRLVGTSGGRATARAIPGARLELIDGMGHDLPRPVWPRLIDGIEETAARARSAVGVG
ncbi:MAG TPA: alpha/beta fold hydrolase [Solirubrobacteraceae bacterium]|nr:alpha/beta fold hydrolase [Solirubrobacteraceae bacterium]